MGLIAKNDKNYGEAVARMKKACDLLAESEKKGEGAFKPYVRAGIGVVTDTGMHALLDIPFPGHYCCSEARL